MSVVLNQRRRVGTFALLLFCLCAVVALCSGGIVSGAAQTASAVSSPSMERQVVRLRVRPKIGGETKGLARKRFYLVRGGLEENAALVAAIKRTPALTRECYYREIGASAELIAWLKEHDCESVYCREASVKDVEGAGAVPEFRTAFLSGRREFGSRELALKWLTVNLRQEIRSGFYRRRQTTLDALIKQAESLSKAAVVSIMTDSKGTAYFTDLEPGTYLITNLVPVETGDSSLLWNCEIRIKPGTPGAQTPFLISNQTDNKSVKCIAAAQPLPACEPTGRP